MKSIHLGHHFFGAGNLGDDFMLAGFLSAFAARGTPCDITCCIPYPAAPMAARFPQVRWIAYDPATRQACIAACDVWLGLGGSPFQSSVSTWFADHLAQESTWCAAADKPMYFLGVGGQDPKAYEVPALRAAANQARMIWTRDPATAESLSNVANPARVRSGADLSHIYFSATRPPAAARSRTTAVLNFDYGEWPGRNAALEALARLHSTEQIWLSQETRVLPGAEQSLFSGLPPLELSRWRLQIADTPGDGLNEVLSRWPSAEWLLTSRFHATLAGAWAGSRAVVIATNDKLRGVASECGYPCVDPAAGPETVRRAFENSSAPPSSFLEERARKAYRACQEFFELAGI